MAEAPEDFRQSTVMSGPVDFFEYIEKNSPNDENKLVGVCLQAITKYKVDTQNIEAEIDLLGTLIADGAKNPEQKKLAERIARALSKTELFRSASHTVRNNIESALSGGAWFLAKVKELVLVPKNLIKYGVDNAERQKKLIDSSMQMITATGNDLGQLRGLREEFIGRMTGKDPVFSDKKAAGAFFDGFVQELDDLQYMLSFTVTGEGRVAVGRLENPEGNQGTPEESIKADIARPVEIECQIKLPGFSAELGESNQRLLNAFGVANEQTAREYEIEARYQINPQTGGEYTSEERAPHREKELYKRVSQDPSVTTEQIFKEMENFSDTSIKYLMRYAIASLKYGEGNVDASRRVLEAYNKLVIAPWGQMPDGTSAQAFARKEPVLFLNELRAAKKLSPEELSLLYRAIGAEVPAS